MSFKEEGPPDASCVRVYIGEVPLSNGVASPTKEILGYSCGWLGSRSITCQLSSSVILCTHALTFSFMRLYEVVIP